MVSCVRVRTHTTYTATVHRLLLVPPPLHHHHFRCLPENPLVRDCFQFLPLAVAAAGVRVSVPQLGVPPPQGPPRLLLLHLLHLLNSRQGPHLARPLLPVPLHHPPPHHHHHPLPPRPAPPPPLLEAAPTPALHLLPLLSTPRRLPPHILHWLSKRKKNYWGIYTSDDRHIETNFTYTRGLRITLNKIVKSVTNECKHPLSAQLDYRTLLFTVLCGKQI